LFYLSHHHMITLYIIAHLGPKRSVIAVMVMTMVSACASAGAKPGAHRTDCGLTDSDAIFAVGGLVYHDCAVDRAAHLTASNHPDFRPPTTNTACYSVDIEFVVDTAGRPETETARVVSTTDQPFAQSVLASLKDWKFNPAIRDGMPVRQIMSSHQAMQVGRVTVPAGAARPSRPSASQRSITC
jgi:hypothetical protein